MSGRGGHVLAQASDANMAWCKLWEPEPSAVLHTTIAGRSVAHPRHVVLDACDSVKVSLGKDEHMYAHRRAVNAALSMDGGTYVLEGTAELAGGIKGALQKLSGHYEGIMAVGFSVKRAVLCALVDWQHAVFAEGFLRDAFNLPESADQKDAVKRMAW